jgi:hypothetical protein
MFVECFAAARTAETQSMPRVHRELSWFGLIPLFATMISGRHHKIPNPNSQIALAAAGLHEGHRAVADSEFEKRTPGTGASAHNSFRNSRLHA